MKNLFKAFTGGLFLGILLMAAVFLAGMRANSQPVVTRVRQFNRKVSNPRMMKTAGQPGVTTSIIRHVGRTSGAEYETPVGAVETDDGFVIGLPYGLEADWAKNVLAAGSATLVHDGQTHHVVRPRWSRPPMSGSSSARVISGPSGSST